MEHYSKLSIYKGMIQYILDKTPYTLKHIAQLTNASLDNIRTIYCGNTLPRKFKRELDLVKLYMIIIDINLHNEECLCANQLHS